MKKELNSSYRTILSVALPIMVGSFVQFIVNFTDTAFLGQLGETALNASGNAGLLYITLFVAGQGFSTAIQVLVARRNGQNKKSQVGIIFDHGLISLIGMALLLFLITRYLVAENLGLLVNDPAIIEGMQDFLKYRAWGYFFSVLQLGIIGYYMGIARTTIMIWSTAIVSLVNIFLAWSLIYGENGFPQMGIGGAALASTISEGITLLFVLVYLFFDPKTRYYGLLRFRIIKPGIFVKIFRLASPLIGQRFVSLFAWTAFFLFIEKTGSHNLAVSQIVRTLYFLAFIPIMGFGSATGTFVSHYMATYDHENVIRVMKKIALISAVATLVFTHGYLLYPAPILRLITSQPELISDTIPILSLIISSMLIHSAVMVIFSGVSGVGDTRASFFIELVSILIYLAYCWYFCLYRPASLMVIWAAEFVYFGILAILSVAYFKWAPWKQYTI